MVRRWHGLEEVPRGGGPSVVVIGVFDGVHRGHQEVLRVAADRARAAGASVVAVALDPHPDTVLRGLPRPAVLTPPDRRADLLAAHGADAVCELPFTEELSRLSAADFVRRVLVERLRAAAVVVGADFRFGHRAAGDAAVLRELGAVHGFGVDAVPVVTGAGGERVSATLVRRRVAEGDVAGAAAALGRPHRVDGVVVHGAARGRELLGFPTANLDTPPRTAVPADGVYAGWLLRTDAAPGEEARWPAAISVGTNPTFDGAVRTVEGYALDRDDLRLYGAAMAMEFVHHIRPQLRFDGVDALIAAMARDVDTARRLMSAT